MTDEQSSIIPFAPRHAAAQIGWKRQELSSSEKEKVISQKKSKNKNILGNASNSSCQEECCDSDEEIISSSDEHASANYISNRFPLNLDDEVEINGDNEAKIISATADAIEISLQGSDAGVTICGRYALVVKEGEVNILGYKMTSSSPSVIIESPKWLSAIVVENSNILSTATVIIRQLKGNTDSINHVDSQTHTETHDNSLSKRRRKDGISFYYFDGLHIYVNPSRIRTIIQIPISWQQSVNSFVQDIFKRRHHQIIDDDDDADIIWNNNETGRPPPKMLICGAKGVGKSTLLRYTANRILSEYNDDGASNASVAILDCDVGQPEFSPPGIVSLTIVSQPILTSPHCHMMYGEEKSASSENVENSGKRSNSYCEQSYYFGYTTSKADPQTYLHFISKLMEAYQQLAIRENSDVDNGFRHPLPLIVNCDGWVKSMGRDILATIILDIVNPDHIVQIVGPTKSTSFELPIPESSTNTKVHVVEIFGAQHQQQQQSANRPILAPSVQPKDLRSLRLCTYFLGGSLELQRLGLQFTEHFADIFSEIRGSRIIGTRLAAMIPYRVPFDAIECRLIDRAISLDTFTDEMFFDCMNGAIVGLGVVDGSDDLFCPSCAGLGIVRSIDRKARILYILTPIPFEKLKCVTILLIGGQIELPIECLVSAVSESFPYVQISNNIASPSMSILGDD